MTGQTAALSCPVKVELLCFFRVKVINEKETPVLFWRGAFYGGGLERRVYFL